MHSDTKQILIKLLDTLTDAVTISGESLLDSESMHTLIDMLEGLRDIQKPGICSKNQQLEAYRKIAKQILRREK